MWRARQTPDIAHEMANASVAVSMRWSAIGFAFVDKAATSTDGLFAVGTTVPGGVAT